MINTKKTNKKNKKGNKIKGSKLTQIKKASEPLYAVPESTNEWIDIKKISQSGIFDLGDNIYSRTYSFSDINWEGEPEESQIQLFDKFVELLDSIDAKFKITMMNRKIDMKSFTDDIYMKEKMDTYDLYRDAYNDHFDNIISKTRNGIELSRYITISCERNSFDEAKSYFNTVESTIQNCFRQLGSDCKALDGNERLDIIQKFYTNGEEFVIKADVNNYIDNYDDFTSDIAASYIESDEEYFELNKKKYGQALFISAYDTNELPDRFLKYLCDIPSESIISIDYEPIPKNVAKNFIENKMLQIEARIIRQQRRRNKNRDFSSDISYRTRNEKLDVEDIMDDLRDNDQNALFISTTIIVVADSIDELNSKVDSFKNICRNNGLKLESCYLKQRQAISTALPLGKKYLETGRFMLTSSAAAFVPFISEELNDYSKDSLTYGYNPISKKIIHGNRKKLLNGNGLILGKPGAGKSVSLKDELSQVFMSTSDDIIVIDPAGECLDLVNKFNGSYCNLSNNATNFINPLSVNINDLDENDTNGIIGSKCELMLSLSEKAHKKELSAILISIIDECTRKLYYDIIKGNRKEEPKLEDFQKELCRRTEDAAQELAIEFNIFINGSLNIFNHKTNIDIKNRFMCFGIRDLGERLFTMAMVNVMEFIKNKVYENFMKGIATWVFIDEYHILLGDEFTETYLYKFIKEVRKLLGIVTCSTQNVKDFFQSYKPATMFENCEYIVLHRQGPSDARDLVGLIDKLNTEAAKYLTSCDAGCGIMIWGNSVLRFNRQFEKDNILYNLFNTNGHEKATISQGIKEV